jgi:hypothetical protein
MDNSLVGKHKVDAETLYNFLMNIRRKNSLDSAIKKDPNLENAQIKALENFDNTTKENRISANLVLSNLITALQQLIPQPMQIDAPTLTNLAKLEDTPKPGIPLPIDATTTNAPKLEDAPEPLIDLSDVKDNTEKAILNHDILPNLIETIHKIIPNEDNKLAKNQAEIIAQTATSPVGDHAKANNAKANVPAAQVGEHAPVPAAQVEEVKIPTVADLNLSDNTLPNLIEMLQKLIPNEDNKLAKNQTEIIAQTATSSVGEHEQSNHAQANHAQANVPAAQVGEHANVPAAQVEEHAPVPTAQVEEHAPVPRVPIGEEVKIPTVADLNLSDNTLPNLIEMLQKLIPNRDDKLLVNNEGHGVGTMNSLPAQNNTTPTNVQAQVDVNQPLEQEQVILLKQQEEQAKQARLQEQVRLLEQQQEQAVQAVQVLNETKARQLAAEEEAKNESDARIKLEKENVANQLRQQAEEQTKQVKQIQDQKEKNRIETERLKQVSNDAASKIQQFVRNNRDTNNNKKNETLSNIIKVIHRLIPALAQQPAQSPEYSFMQTPVDPSTLPPPPSTQPRTDPSTLSPPQQVDPFMQTQADPFMQTRAEPSTLPLVVPPPLTPPTQSQVTTEEEDVKTKKLEIDTALAQAEVERQRQRAEQETRQRELVEREALAKIEQEREKARIAIVNAQEEAKRATNEKDRQIAAEKIRIANETQAKIEIIRKEKEAEFKKQSDEAEARLAKELAQAQANADAQRALYEETKAKLTEAERLRNVEEDTRNMTDMLTKVVTTIKDLIPPNLEQQKRDAVMLEQAKQETERAKQELERAKQEAEQVKISTEIAINTMNEQMLQLTEDSTRQIAQANMQSDASKRLAETARIAKQKADAVVAEAIKAKVDAETALASASDSERQAKADTVAQLQQIAAQRQQDAEDANQRLEQAVRQATHEAKLAQNLLTQAKLGAIQIRSEADKERIKRELEEKLRQSNEKANLKESIHKTLLNIAINKKKTEGKQKPNTDDILSNLLSVIKQIIPATPLNPEKPEVDNEYRVVCTDGKMYYPVNQRYSFNQPLYIWIDNFMILHDSTYMFYIQEGEGNNYTMNLKNIVNLWKSPINEKGPMQIEMSLINSEGVNITYLFTILNEPTNELRCYKLYEMLSEIMKRNNSNNILEPVPLPIVIDNNKESLLQRILAKLKELITNPVTQIDDNEKIKTLTDLMKNITITTETGKAGCNVTQVCNGNGTSANGPNDNRSNDNRSNDNRPKDQPSINNLFDKTPNYALELAEEKTKAISAAQEAKRIKDEALQASVNATKYKLDLDNAQAKTLDIVNAHKVEIEKYKKDLEAAKRAEAQAIADLEEDKKNNTQPPSPPQPQPPQPPQPLSPTAHGDIGTIYINDNAQLSKAINLVDMNN